MVDEPITAWLTWFRASAQLNISFSCKCCSVPSCYLLLVPLAGVPVRFPFPSHLNGQWYNSHQVSPLEWTRTREQGNKRKKGRQNGSRPSARRNEGSWARVSWGMGVSRPKWRRLHASKVELAHSSTCAAAFGRQSMRQAAVPLRHITKESQHNMTERMQTIFTCFCIPCLLASHINHHFQSFNYLAQALIHSPFAAIGKAIIQLVTLKHRQWMPNFLPLGALFPVIFLGTQYKVLKECDHLLWYDEPCCITGTNIHKWYSSNEKLWEVITHTFHISKLFTGTL